MPDTDIQVIAEGKYIRLVSRGKWEYTDRKGISGIVGIVAVNDEGKMILVEQFRPAVNRRVIEIPAGLAGDVKGSEDEALELAAMRELLEETGYQAQQMERLTSGVVSAGITDEVVSLFRATGLKKTGAGGGDASEEIEVHEVPVDEVPRWIEQRKKTCAIVDLKVYTALYFAMTDAER